MRWNWLSSVLLFILLSDKVTLIISNSVIPFDRLSTITVTTNQAAVTLPPRTFDSIIMNRRGGGTDGGGVRTDSPHVTRGGEAMAVTTITHPLLKLRQAIFPIYGSQEVTKFLLIGAIKFFVILALTLTRDTKDTLVVTQCGAEAIAFLKIYGVLPAATAFIALYSKLSNALGKKALFYTVCIPFFVFFQLFATVIYPNASLLHPALETVQSYLPGGAAASGGTAILANIVAHWTSAVFYVVSEIYSSVSVGLLFWQFANDVVSIDQAKRFYPLFAQMSGLAPVLAGQYVVHYASQTTDFATSMNRLTGAVSLSGIMICIFYYLSSRFVEQTERHSSTVNEISGDVSATSKKKKKPKMSMVESIKFLASSQYLRLIAVLVLGYGLSINFTEIIWKSLVKKRYPDPIDYQRFMGNVSSAVGLSTTIVIFFGVHVIRILGWKVGALATPSTMALLAIPFFACIFLGLDSPSRLYVAVLFGTIQSLLSKTAKYALFDPTTQMAYIPLDEESKVKGKVSHGHRAVLQISCLVANRFYEMKPPYRRLQSMSWGRD